MVSYVLVVEGDRDLQAHIAEVLRDAPYELGSETELSWARKSLAARAPDAVIIDTQLGDGPGILLADELRRGGRVPAIPILFIASRHFRGAQHRAELIRRYAPASYVLAPSGLGELRPTLDGLLAQGERTRPAAPVTATTIPSASAAAARSAAPSGASARASGPPPPASPSRPSSSPTMPMRRAPAPAVPPPLPPGALARAAEVPRVPVAQVREAAQTVAPVASAPRPAPAPADLAQQSEKRDVDRAAEILAQGTGGLRGTLAETPFARLLQRLFAQRTTGALLLKLEGTKKIVSFADGYPVSVKSNLLSECLGQILLQQRLISNEALQESLRRMKVEKRHQGQILVEMGVLSPYNLSRALVEQVEAKLFNIFSWPEGLYVFKEGEPTPVEALRLDRSPAAMILEGIRRHYDEQRREGVLAPYAGKYVRLSSDPVMRFQEMTSLPTEREFVRGIDGRTRLETVLDSARITRDKARLLLVALAEAGMIEPSEAPAPRPESPAGVAGTVSGAEGGRGGTGGATTGGGQEAGDGDGGYPEAGRAPARPLTPSQLSLVAQTVRSQNHYWALGVQPSDSIETVDRAYEALAASFHPDRYRAQPDEDRRLAQEIFERLTEAHATLRDPARRQGYTATIERARSPEPSGPIPAGAPRELYDTGMEHLRANHHREAVESFRQAARLLPNQSDFRAALGWALFREAPADARAGRAALAELRRAIQLDPKNRRARLYLGHFHAQTGQSDLAIAEFEKLLELDPGATDVSDELRRLRENR
jgi:CheY-like chemotaxis protein/DnaJ-domain-containing protein 1